MATWKIEQYSVDVLPNLATLEQYTKLSLRDSVILTAAVFDIALAELIQRRLTGPAKEIIEFLGADGDGRAPCGSFGSRIQLARLLGVIVDEDVSLLRKLKNVRNAVAHRVNARMDNAAIRQSVLLLWEEAKSPIGVAILAIEKLVAGDPTLVRLAEERHGAETLAHAKEQWKSVEARFAVLVDGWQAPQPSPGVILEALIGVVLENAEHADSGAAGMLGLLAATYKSRFDLLLETVEAVTTIELPSTAIKMWKSDKRKGD